MTKGLFIGNSHANGGIPSEIAETGTKIEIEGNEYYICNEAYNSDDVFEFKNKTNKEILDYIYTEFACKLNQDIMHTGDFIVCKVVVADKKKKNRKGTIKQILNEMQGEKNCKVESGNNYKNGGAILLALNGNKSNLTPEQYKLVRTPAFKSWFGDWEKLANAKLKDSGMDEVTLLNLSKDVSKVVDENGEPRILYHGTDVNFNIYDLSKTGEGSDLLGKGIYLTEKKEVADFYANLVAKKRYIKGYEQGIFGTESPIYEKDADVKAEKHKVIYEFFVNAKNVIDINEIEIDNNIKEIFIESIRDMFQEDSEQYVNEKIDFANKNYKQIKNYRGILLYLIDRFPDAKEEIFEYIKGKYDCIIFEPTVEFENDLGEYKNYVVFNPNQIKLADGTNTTFDSNNPDIRFDEGGNIDNYDLYSVYFPSDEEIERINEKNRLSEEQEKEDEYQRSKFSKRWAATRKIAIDKLVKQYLDAKKTYDDWASRQYKQNKSQVFLGGDDVFGQTMSIGYINENRKKRVLRSSKMLMEESLADLKEIGLKESEIDALINKKEDNLLFEKSGNIKPIRFEAGKKLTESEKKEVYKELKDSYKVNQRPFAEENDKIVWLDEASDYMTKSDITGRLLRWYIYLPDGRIAHPTEVFGASMPVSEVERVQNNIEYHERQADIRYNELVKLLKLKNEIGQVVEAIKTALNNGAKFKKQFDSNDLGKKDAHTTLEFPNDRILSVPEYVIKNIEYTYLGIDKDEFIKIKVKGLRNKYVNGSLSDIDWERFYNEFKETEKNDMEKINFIEGNYYYYKNSIMSEAIKVKLIEKQEWENGNIESLTFKKPDGSTLNLKNSDIKYITDVRKEADGYSFEKKLNSFINNFINESPKQILGIINSIDKKESKGVSNLTFTEEVKEGRARKFNTSNPLKLKGKEFSYDGITLTINDIKYIGENIQPSDYNEYVDFDYSLTYSIKYDNNDMEKPKIGNVFGDLVLDRLEKAFKKRFPNDKFEREALIKSWNETKNERSIDRANQNLANLYLSYFVSDLRGIIYSDLINEVKELEKGIAVEQEHRDTLEKVAAGNITPEQAIVETAQEHIAENPNYYEDLSKMEKENFESSLPEWLKQEFLEISEDGEFQSDYNLLGNQEAMFEKMVTDKELFLRLLNNYKNDYESDIEMEKSNGNDYKYLVNNYNDIIKLLNKYTNNNYKNKYLFDNETKQDLAKNNDNKILEKIEKPKIETMEQTKIGNDDWAKIPAQNKYATPVISKAYQYSPYDKTFQKITENFTASDGLRPVYSTVNFSDKGICVTDEHKLLYLNHISEQFNGNYCVTPNCVKLISNSYDKDKISDDKLDVKYPVFEAVIPSTVEFVYDVDLLALKTYCEIVIRSGFVNKITNKIALTFNNKNIIAVNGKFLIEACESFLLMGHRKVKVGITSRSRALLFVADNNYDGTYKPVKNSDFFLIMPIMDDEYEFNFEYMQGDIDFDNLLNIAYSLEKDAVITKGGEVFHKIDTSITKKDIKDAGELDIKQLQIASSFIKSSKNRLPILDNVLVKDKTMYLSNLEISYSISNIDMPDGVYEIRGTALFPAKHEMNDFPKMPEGLEKVGTINRQEFIKLFEYTLDFVGDDVLRELLTGVNFVNEGTSVSQQIVIQATDAYAGFRKEISNVNIDKVFDIIIGKPKTIYKILESFDCDEIDFYLADNYSAFECGAGKVYFRTIDGVYPKLKNVYADSVSKKIFVDSKDLKDIASEMKKVAKSGDYKIDDLTVLFDNVSGGKASYQIFDKEVKLLASGEINLTIKDLYVDETISNFHPLFMPKMLKDKQTFLGMAYFNIQRLIDLGFENLEIGYNAYNKAVYVLNKIELAGVKKTESQKKKEVKNKAIIDVENETANIINKAFNEWNNISNESEHEKWSNKVSGLRFGTYKNQNILDVIEKFEPKYPNEVIKKDFIKELYKALKIELPESLKPKMEIKPIIEDSAEVKEWKEAIENLNMLIDLGGSEAEISEWREAIDNLNMLIEMEAPKMAKGGGVGEQKLTNIKKYLSQFPDNAKNWGEATEEIRDMSRVIANFYEDDNIKRLNFRELKTPSEWNTKGKKFILDTYNKLSENQKDNFYDYFKHWFENEEYAKGGYLANENALMVANNNKQIFHHTKEMAEALKGAKNVPAWVVAKVNRSASDLSDATHYLEGAKGMYADGGSVQEELPFQEEDLSGTLFAKGGEMKEYKMEKGGKLIFKPITTPL